MSKLPSFAASGGRWRALALLAFVVELLLFSSWRGRLGFYFSPLVFGASGILLGVAALAALRDQPFARMPAGPGAGRVAAVVALWLAGTALVLYRQVPVVLGTPVDVRTSDVIPIVQAYVDRFRAGEVVYRYLTTLPYPLFPNHLPLQWLPYVPARALGLDFRWVSWGLLLGLGVGAYQLATLRLPGRWWQVALRALLPALALWQVISHDFFLYAQVLEPTIIAYYFLLAASVLVGPAWARGGALVLCLLSRYSVVFWVPLFLWMLWREVGRGHALTVLALVVAGIVGIYVVPFLAPNPTIFTHALAEYRIATLGEWSRLLPGTNMPTHLGNGLSALPWVYTFGPASLEARVTLAQRLHALASVGAALALAAFYWRYGHRYDYRYLALISLKLYLVVFYFFIQIPYAYLISLSVLLSTFVAALLLAPPAAPAEPVAAAPAARV